MLNLNGIIRRRQQVELSSAQTKTIEKLYDKSVIEDTIVEQITYLSDDLHIKGYIAKPKKEGTYPTLIWNRGGSGDKGALDDLRAYLILASTAVWGYTVLASQYRGNMGSEGDEDWGGDDLRDSLHLIETAKNLPECDENRIAVEGPSRGGMVTYRALLKYPDFKCAMVHAGITDVIKLIERKRGFKEYLDERYSHLKEQEKKWEMQKLSATHFAEKLPDNCPILIMHGTEDTTIPIEQSELLVEQLKKYDKPHKCIRIEGGTHVALKDGTYKEIDRHRKEWLEKYL